MFHGLLVVVSRGDLILGTLGMLSSRFDGNDPAVTLGRACGTEAVLLAIVLEREILLAGGSNIGSIGLEDVNGLFVIV